MNKNQELFKLYHLDPFEEKLFNETLIKQQQQYIKDLLVYQGQLQAQIDELKFKLGKVPDKGLKDLAERFLKYGVTHNQFKKLLKISKAAYLQNLWKQKPKLKAPVSKIVR